MIFLTFVACLAHVVCDPVVTPSNRRYTQEVKQALVDPYNSIEGFPVAADDRITPFQCMMYGQIQMQKWLEQHPGYEQISKWTCSTKQTQDL